MHFRSSFSGVKAEPDDGSCKLNRAADYATKAEPVRFASLLGCQLQLDC